MSRAEHAREQPLDIGLYLASGEKLCSEITSEDLRVWFLDPEQAAARLGEETRHGALFQELVLRISAEDRAMRGEKRKGVAMCGSPDMMAPGLAVGFPD